MKRAVDFIKKWFVSDKEDENGAVMESGVTPIPGVHYIPSEDEPSVFSGNSETINHRWMSWYLRRNRSHGYIAMQTAAANIKKQLSIEPPRVYNRGYLPPVLVGNRHSLAVSFEWVIWYKYEFDVTFEEAYSEAYRLTHKE